MFFISFSSAVIQMMFPFCCLLIFQHAGHYSIGHFNSMFMWILRQSWFYRSEDSVFLLHNMIAPPCKNQELSNSSILLVLCHFNWIKFLYIFIFKLYHSSFYLINQDQQLFCAFFSSQICQLSLHIARAKARSAVLQWKKITREFNTWKNR